MDYPVKFGEQLKQQLRSLRKARGWNQTELGARIGVTQRRIAEIEANPAVVAVDQIIKILSALDTEVILRHRSAAADDAPVPSAIEAGPAQGHEFRGALVPSARHLIAALQGHTTHTPAALLVHQKDRGRLDALPAADKRRLAYALASALMVSPHTLDDHLAAVPLTANEPAPAPLPPIVDQWARALAMSPHGLRQAIAQAIAHRSAPAGLASPPPKGVW